MNGNQEYNRESDFEEALVQLLVEQKGWVDGVLRNPTEQELINNWAAILFSNNEDIDRLNGCPLTDTETRQIPAQIKVRK